MFMLTLRWTTVRNYNNLLTDKSPGWSWNSSLPIKLSIAQSPSASLCHLLLYVNTITWFFQCLKFESARSLECLYPLYGFDPLWLFTDFLFILDFILIHNDKIALVWPSHTHLDLYKTVIALSMQLECSWRHLAFILL